MKKPLQKHTCASLVSVIALATVFATSNGALAANYHSIDNTKQNKSTNMVLQNDGDVACWPADVVLLLDQSSSMIISTPVNKPIEERVPPSDPDNYRITGAVEVLKTLVDHRLQRCPQAIHRFGLISFGIRADVIMPLSQIDPGQQSDPNQWVAPYLTKIEEAAQDQTQVATDFIGAFDAAQQLFTKAAPLNDVPGYGPRRKVVILLTDGQPWLPDINLPSYMCQMVDQLQSKTWDGYSFWFVALDASVKYLDNLACNGEVLRNNWNSIVSSHGGELDALTYNKNKIPALLSSILGKVLGKGKMVELTCGETFYVDPYLKEMELFFSESQPDQGNKLQVTLSHLDAKGTTVYQINGGKADLQQTDQLANMTIGSYVGEPGGRTEKYVIENPRPGAWKFTVSGIDVSQCRRDVIALQTSLIADAELTEPTRSKQAGLQRTVPYWGASPFYDQAHPARFAVQLSTKLGQPFEEDPNYPLNIEVSYQLPSGHAALPDGTEVKPVMLTSDRNGRWTSNDVPIFTPELGTYSVYITGTTLNGAMTATLPVFTKREQFEARKVERLYIAIDSPKQDEILPCNSVGQGTIVNRPVDISLTMVDSNRNPTNADKYIPGDKLDKIFQAKLVDSSGATIDAVDLKRGQTAGHFQATMLANASTITACGRISIQVSFSGDLDSSQVVMPDTTTQVGYERMQSDGVVATIVLPTSGKGYLIHPDIPSALPFGGHAQPVLFEMRLSDLAGKPLTPAKVSSGTPQDLYKVRLVSPDAKTSENLVLKSVELADGSALVASAGISITDAGTYFFEVNPQPGAFKPGFIPAVNDIAKVSFDRYDTPFTTPLLWNMITIILVASFAGLIVFSIWSVRTRPLGELQFTSFNETVLHVETLSNSFRHGFRASYKKDNPVRQALGLSKIIVHRDKPDDGHTERAVMVDAYDDDNQLAFTGKMHSGDNKENIGGDVWMKYE